MQNLLSYVRIENKLQDCHENNGKAIAFLPVGCTEQHGPFLPIQTDTIIAENITRHLSDVMRSNYWGYVFPPISYTPTKSNSNYAGTASVNEDQFRLYVKQICSNILEADFDAIVIVCAHSTADASLNEICFNLVHEQYVAKKPVIKPVMAISLYSCRTILEDKFGQKTGQHADWRELLLLVYILGNSYFDKNMIDNITAFQKGNSFQVSESHVYGVPVELRSVQGVIGNPTLESKEDWNDLAKMAWEETINHLSELLHKKLNGYWSLRANVC